MASLNSRDITPTIHSLHNNNNIPPGGGDRQITRRRGQGSVTRSKRVVGLSSSHPARSASSFHLRWTLEGLLGADRYISSNLSHNFPPDMAFQMGITSPEVCPVKYRYQRRPTNRRESRILLATYQNSIHTPTSDKGAGTDSSSSSSNDNNSSSNNREEGWQTVAH